MLNITGVALLTIRVWREEGSQHPLRAEIRIADDVASGFHSTLTFVDADALVEAVRDFVDNVVSPPADGPPVTPMSHLRHVDGEG